MKFHLDFIPEKAPFHISHRDSLFLIGSCFSENIGDLLHEKKFKVFSNPDGILFNPLSICRSLSDSIENAVPNESLFLERDSRFYSFLHHSSIHAQTQVELKSKLNTRRQDSHRALKTTNYLFITFGSAYYYHHLLLNTAVGNCHKQSAQTFEKKCLSIETIVEMYQNLSAQLAAFNPSLKIIFTVSPVKHLRDGIVENNLSKSILLLSVNTLCESNTNCFYFPSFELVNDDLRDYRFYKEDLAHPNSLAIDYVWNKFSDCYFDPASQTLIAEIEKLNKALAHKVLSSESANHDKYLDFIARQRQIVKELLPEIEF